MKLFDKRLQANAPISNDSIMIDNEAALGYTDPNTKYQLKLAQIDAKEKSARRQLNEYVLRINRLEEEQRLNNSTVKSLETNNLRLQQELIKEKERASRLERTCNLSLPKEQALSLKAENENVRMENTQLKSANTTFRNLHEAAVREAKTMRVAIGRNDDENIHLRKEIRELQSESDENSLIGKLFNQVLAEKWTEAAFNKKYDQALDDLRKAKIECSNLESKLRKKEDELLEIQTDAHDKVSGLEKQLFDARMSILPMINISKIEEINSNLKKMSNQKLELEVANKNLRNEMLENQVRLDNYILREQSLSELESILKDRYPDELSLKIVDLSNKITEHKLGELKAQRETSVIKEREEYYMRINKNQINQITALEEAVAGNEAKFNERENFWRSRYNDQMKLLNKKAEEKEQADKEAAKKLSGGGVQKLVRTEIEAGNTAEDKFLRASQPDLNIGMSQSSLNSEVQLMRDKIRLLHEDVKYRDLKIDKLQKEVEAKNVGVNYRTDHVEAMVIGDLENKTRDIASAAQHTVQTLQAMIEDKNRLLEEKERKIDSMRNDIAEKSRTLSKLELENEGLRREVSVGNRHAMNVDQYTALKTMEKINKMDQQDIQRMVADYENKLTILAEELTEAEKVNRELTQKLRGARGDYKLLDNKKTAEANLNELDKLKKDNAQLTNLYKKKCTDVKRLNEVLKNYMADLEQQEKNKVKAESEFNSKVLTIKNEGGHYEEKISVLSKQFSALNEKFATQKKQLQDLKTNEIRTREKLSEQTETINKLTAANVKLKDENSKLNAQKLSRPVTGAGTGNSRRPASGKPLNGSSATMGKSKVGEANSGEIQRLRTQITELEATITDLRSKIAGSSGTEDFLNSEGQLYCKGSMAFGSLEEFNKAMLLYMTYMGHSFQIWNVFRKADPAKTGGAKPETLFEEFEKAGLKFSDRDKQIIPGYLPKTVSGDIDYKAWYYGMKNLTDFSAMASLGGSTGQAASGNKFMPKDRMGRQAESTNVHTLALDKNVDLLKKKILDKDNEINDLTKQLKIWKQTALQHENELKQRNNAGRNNYGLNSTLEAKLGRKDATLKQIQDLEDQVQTLKKELKYEVSKREQTIKELQEDLSIKQHDLALSQSEGQSLRAQIERLLSGRLQKEQVSEELSKERDLLVASLMERLEKSRGLENELRTKLRGVEKENIELKHIKEGIDTRLESLNREIRELKDGRRE